VRTPTLHPVGHVRPWATVLSALADSDRGTPDAVIAEKHGVAIKTVRRWRTVYQREGRPRGQQHVLATCPRCEGGPLDGRAYAELLGWYLGDGHLTASRRGVFALNIINDAQYVEDNAALSSLLRSVKPGCRPHTRQAPGAVILTVSWKHWPCLFPQHGPGRKHTRPIVLEPWQDDLVQAHAPAFLRGLFHSDGARVRNWTTRVVAGRPKRYDYPRWQFSNTSEDILGLCGWALDLAGVEWRRSSTHHISVSTRTGVTKLDSLIGLKR